MLVDKAFLISENTKARALLDSLRNVSQHPATPQSDKIKAAVSKIPKIQLSMQTMKSNEFEKAKNTLYVAFNEYQLLKGGIIPTDTVKTRAPIFSIPEIPKILPANSAIIEYKLTEKNVFCFVITKEKINWVSMHEREKLETLTASLMKLLINPDRSLRGSLYLRPHKLYKFIFKDIIQDVKDIKLLIVIPEGVLNSLPFEALMTSPPTSLNSVDYLIHHFSFVYTPSANVYAFLS